ncbi:hypothetical protein ACFQYP_39270 [Nonomuraea antimicrobica]
MSTTAVTTPSGLRLPRWAAPVGAAALFVAAYLVFQGTGTLPHDKEAPQFLAVTEFREWIDDHRNDNPSSCTSSTTSGSSWPGSTTCSWPACTRSAGPASRV